MYQPDRGDLVWLEFSPQAGHEQSGRRPALVLSPRSYNAKVGLMLCCPVTSKSKGHPFEVALDDNAPVMGVVLADQIRSLDWRSRNAAYIDNAGGVVTQRVLDRVRVLLD